MTDDRKLELSPELGAEYEIVRELGRGTMGSVWLARHKRLNRNVALKFVRGGGDTAARLRREAKILAGLTHPNLVGILDAGFDGERSYLALEYVDGESLQHRLARQRKLPASEAMSIAEEVAISLEYIHRQGVLHRDLKPGNILLPGTGGVKLADFGLAAWTEKQGQPPDAGGRGPRLAGLHGPGAAARRRWRCPADGAPDASVTAASTPVLHDR